MAAEGVSTAADATPPRVSPVPGVDIDDSDDESATSTGAGAVTPPASARSVAVAAAPQGMPGLPKVIMFSSSTCKHCKAAKALLAGEGVEYAEASIGDFPEERKVLYEHTQHPTVPQIFIGATFLGGADSLKAVHAEGKLKSTIVDAPPAEAWLSALATNVITRGSAGQAEAWGRALQARLTAETTALAAEPLPFETYLVLDALNSATGTGAKAQTTLFGGVKSAAGAHAGLVAASHTIAELTSAVETKAGVSGEDAKGLIEQAVWSGVLAPLTGKGSVSSPGSTPWITATALASTVAADATATPALAESWGMNWLPGLSDAPPSAPATWETRGAAASATAAGDGGAAQYAKRIADLYLLASKGLSSALQSDGSTGTDFNYGEAPGHPAWSLYKRAAALLARCNVTLLAPDDRLALILNVYNGLTIHGIVEKGQASTTAGRAAFFAGTSYRLGGLVFSLDDVEHGILRANKKHPYKFSPQFPSSDLRKAIAAPSVDCRVHFAMVCGAKGCPPVRVYTPASVQQELNEAARAFVSDTGNVTPDPGAKTLTLSRIFYWFRKDFGGNDAAVFRFVSEHAAGAQATALAAISGSAAGGGWFGGGGKAATGGWTVKYGEYDWSLNGSGAKVVS